MKKSWIFASMRLGIIAFILGMVTDALAITPIKTYYWFRITDTSNPQHVKFAEARIMGVPNDGTPETAVTVCCCPSTNKVDGLGTLAGGGNYSGGTTGGSKIGLLSAYEGASNGKTKEITGGFDYELYEKLYVLLVDQNGDEVGRSDLELTRNLFATQCDYPSMYSAGSAPNCSFVDSDRPTQLPSEQIKLSATPANYTFYPWTPMVYWTVEPPKEAVLVDTDEFEFTIDTRTERTAVAGSTETFTIPDAVWEAAGGNPVTVTYTKDGGAAQTLGTYKQGDKVEWTPIYGGTYVFTFGSSEYQASFHVDKTPGIFITSARQRWPWNGMVDIGYFVEGLDPEKEYTATFHVTCKGETKSFTLAGIVNGDATTAWDAAAATAWGKTLVKEPATVSADLRCLTVKEPEKWGTYMIVDLTKLGQAGCVTYETKESAEAACNAYNRDEYKTTKLVLRKVAKGQAYPVKPGATANLTDADVMTPQKDYYIGVFMVTNAQYDYVMGVSTTSTDKNPTPYLTYNEIRKNDIDTGNAMSPLNPVCNNSFMHRLVQGCLDADGNAVGRFDLPTEIQWEIACRAGSFAERGSYLDASFQEITLTQALIKNVVCGSALKAVGTYRPNAWGLYDMLGNLWQWCLDESIAYTDYTHVDVETPYFSGLSPKRMLRGYYYNTMAVSIRPGGQNAAQDAYANQYWNGGIRVCHVED